MIRRPEEIDIGGTVYTGVWSTEKIPVYTVLSPDGLNQFVGYVKHINAANGTVLYRGQCNLYPTVIPSICRNREALAKNKAELDRILEIMAADEGVNKYWHLGEDGGISAWREYKKLILEATLQHYGANTFCVDFVDNHWTALWFGLYRWNNGKTSYQKRTTEKQPDEDQHLVFDMNALPFVKAPEEPKYTTEDMLPEGDILDAKRFACASGKSADFFLKRKVYKIRRGEIAKWKAAQERYSNNPVRKDFHIDNEKGHMYLFLYVADTNVPTVRGISMGKDTYVLDLRKTIPSTFLRPCSQHGWIVKGIQEEHYCYEKRIACVLRIGVELVDQMLGDGVLTSERNFFPPYENDHGYDILLRRQEGTNRKPKKYPKILPANTIPVLVDDDQ